MNRRPPAENPRDRSVPFRLAACAIILALALAAPTSAPAQTPEVRVDAETEQVIQGALRWLAAAQSPSGAWFSAPNDNKHAASMTGYTLMAFLVNGHLPDEGEHRKTVAQGLRFLLETVQPDGNLRDIDGKSYMYSHGIVTTALASIYGQSRDPALRADLERMVRVILSAQNKEGGWRYQPRPKDADISVSVLQVVALRAAKNAGIDVPQETIDRAIAYVRSCHHANSGGFTYQPGRGDAGFARTAAALYSLQVCGEYTDPRLGPASAYLLANLRQKRWWTYGNYYAAPALFMMGGDSWKRYYAEMRKELLAGVRREGNQAWWDTNLDNQKDGVGPVYCTAVYTTILAMPYHYLPLYQR